MAERVGVIDGLLFLGNLRNLRNLTLNFSKIFTLGVRGGDSVTVDESAYDISERSS